VVDIPGAVRDAMRSLCLQEQTKPRQTVAVTAGSRGIANIDRISRAVVDELKSLRLQPFIVPAMGSHGAHGRGQRAILAHWDPRGFHGVPDQGEHRRSWRLAGQRGPRCSVTGMPGRPTTLPWWAGSTPTRISAARSKAASSR
jgi:hypothetical protein